MDHVIDQKLIPALTENHRCSTNERTLLSLPVRLGGLGIPILSEIAEEEFKNSQEMTTELVNNIVNQVKEKIKGRRTRTRLETLQKIRSEMSELDLKANDLAQMKGASNWLTTLPLKAENFDLSKREFFDAIAIRYRWNMKHLPERCACGKSFSLDHALSCPKGGFIYQRHNELRDSIAYLISEVKNDVTIEPHLEPLTGEQLPAGTIQSDGARADISASGFWTRGQRAFFDIKVFNAYAQRYSRQSLRSSFVANEREKKRCYNNRIIQVDKGSFTPLIFSTNGGMGIETQHFLKALATHISDKKDERYSLTMNWLRTKLSFALTRSSITCVRGTRVVRKIKNIDIEITEATGYRPVL